MKVPGHCRGKEGEENRGVDRKDEKNAENIGKSCQELTHVATILKYMFAKKRHFYR